MYIKSFFLGFALAVGLIAVPVFAIQAPDATTVELINPIGGSEGTTESRRGVDDLRVTIGNVIGKVLGVVGSLAFLAFIVGGFLWLTSAGNADRVQKGSTAMLYATIGLFVIFGAYAILNTILGGLAQGGGPAQEQVSPDSQLTACKQIKFDECPGTRCEKVEISGKKACIELTCSKQNNECVNKCADDDDACPAQCETELEQCYRREIGR